jgi:hypothetical protein
LFDSVYQLQRVVHLLLQIVINNHTYVVIELALFLCILERFQHIFPTRSLQRDELLSNHERPLRLHPTKLYFRTASRTLSATARMIFFMVMVMVMPLVSMLIPTIVAVFSHNI